MNKDRNDDLPNRLANLDQLRGARRRVRFEFAPSGPFVSVVVMIDIAEEQAVGGAMHDDPDVRTDAQGPEVFVARFVQFVKTQAGTVRAIGLQVKGRRLDGLLLVSRKPGEAVGKGVGDQEVHTNISIIQVSGYHHHWQTDIRPSRHTALFHLLPF